MFMGRSLLAQMSYFVFRTISKAEIVSEVVACFSVKAPAPMVWQVRSLKWHSWFQCQR